MLAMFSESFCTYKCMPHFIFNAQPRCVACLSVDKSLTDQALVTPELSSLAHARTICSNQHQTTWKSRTGQATVTNYIPHCTLLA
mmetsp:Transcript_31332/g.81852  ORF Transcript_31332/g.81852 Transcript_31332/m.81852 type:complete len:85 (+) Transcript_31332:109-363(+)